MSLSNPTRRHFPSMVRSFLPAALALTALAVTACAPSTVSSNSSVTPMGNASTAAPSPDPRVGLRPGLYDAAEAAWNLKLVSTTKPSEKFVGGINSDGVLASSEIFSVVATRSTNNAGSRRGRDRAAHDEPGRIPPR